MAGFTAFIGELTKEDRAVKFFSLSANTLDKVFCRLIQDSNFSAHKIKQSIITKHKRTERASLHESQRNFMTFSYRISEYGPGSINKSLLL